MVRYVFGFFWVIGKVKGKNIFFKEFCFFFKWVCFVLFVGFCDSLESVAFFEEDIL